MEAELGLSSEGWLKSGKKRWGEGGSDLGALGLVHRPVWSRPCVSQEPVLALLIYSGKHRPSPASRTTHNRHYLRDEKDRSLRKSTTQRWLHWPRCQEVSLLSTETLRLWRHSRGAEVLVLAPEASQRHLDRACCPGATGWRGPRRSSGAGKYQQHPRSPHCAGSQNTSCCHRAYDDRECGGRERFCSLTLQTGDSALKGRPSLRQRHCHPAESLSVMQTDFLECSLVQSFLFQWYQT